MSQDLIEIKAPPGYEMSYLQPGFESGGLISPIAFSSAVQEVVEGLERPWVTSTNNLINDENNNNNNNKYSYT